MTDSWTSNLSFIQWDGKNDSGQLCTPGIYVFKVTVSHTQDGGVDTVCDKSTTTLSSLSLSAVNSQGSTYTTNVYGSTSGSVDNGQMTIFKPDLDIAVTQSYNVASAQIGALVKTYSYAPSSICGDYRLFLCGDDNNLATDKSHRSRPILGASIVQRVYGLSFYFNNTVPTIKSAPYVSLNGTPINRSSGFYISTCGKAIGTSYVPQSLPDPDDADAIKSTLSYGSPTGYLSWSSPQAGVSPTLFVFYGHGESSRLLCSNNTYLTTSDIDTLPMPLDNNAGRLAILHACFTASGGSTSFAYHLHNRGWRVIAFSTEVPNTLLDRLEEVWMDHWSSHNFGMSSDELQTSFSDTKAQLGNEYPYPMPEHAVVLGLTLL